MKLNLKLSIPNFVLAHAVGFWHICMLIRSKYAEDEYYLKVHLVPGLAYIAMNCKDHALTRLLFFLAQVGFCCYFYS